MILESRKIEWTKNPNFFTNLLLIKSLCMCICKRSGPPYPDRACIKRGNISKLRSFSVASSRSIRNSTSRFYALRTILARKMALLCNGALFKRGLRFFFKSCPRFSGILSEKDSFGQSAQAFRNVLRAWQLKKKYLFVRVYTGHSKLSFLPLALAMFQ